MGVNERYGIGSGGPSGVVPEWSAHTNSRSSEEHSNSNQAGLKGYVRRGPRFSLQLRLRTAPRGQELNKWIKRSNRHPKPSARVVRIRQASTVSCGTIGRRRYGVGYDVFEGSFRAGKSVVVAGLSTEGARRPSCRNATAELKRRAPPASRVS
ncbi:hypothetical protein K1T71_004994 [Dendrolimus kikuchii]|uniref:Uncharacterized protein n=1 Tax=Dendrolimus kikuchii TaxID=765133 RepID=A0ACC1D608_9NEOP|nr:hypothetical protein K1T71_004994 [Dendrolimus kikuchii]